MTEKHKKRKHKKPIKWNIKRDWNETTKRYCKICKKMSTFKYDKYLGHSVCLKCGLRPIKIK